MRPKVFHLEDNEAQRIATQLSLELRGFTVGSPESIAEAKSLLDREGASFDVVILDMNLDGYKDYQGETGGRLAIDFLRANEPLWRPEFLILSAYQSQETQTSALQLGVAAYLSKQEAGMENLINHVRVLALRHALSNPQPEIAGDISSIAQNSINEVDAILKFSKSSLIPAMKASLGLPFFLLLTTQKTTENNGQIDTFYVGGNIDWPTTSNYYEVLQSLAYSSANDPKPVQIFDGLLPPPVDDIDRALYAKLEGGALIPIAVSNDLLFSIFFARGDQSAPLLESPLELGQVMTQYFRSFILSLLLELLIKVREKTVRQKTILRETARFCLLLGQEQKESLKEMAASENGDDSLRLNKTFSKLKLMAEKLYRTGTLLKELSEFMPAIIYESASLLEVIRDVWKELDRLEIAKGTSLKLPEVDFSIQMAKDDLWLLLITLLQWLGQRRSVAPENRAQEIKVSCLQHETMAELVLEDSSPRLFTPLRAKLFEPWTITTSDEITSEGDVYSRPSPSFAMYLAKAIVEFKYSGQLLDCSDEIAGDVGHRFVIRLPIKQTGDKE
jgi:CheY-like chemotaxis protein